MKRLLLSVLCLSGCLWGATERVISEAQQELTEETRHAWSHNCACHPNRRTKLWYWCDPDGTHNPKGTNTCCGICDANCGKTRSVDVQKLPITPPCESIADHLEGCGGGDVCSKCKHPCP